MRRGLGKSPAAVGLGALLAAAPLTPIAAATPEEHFERSVRPLLDAKCAACHGPATLMGGLDLTSASGLARGADSGQVVVPGQPGDSRLILAVEYGSDIRMPPTGKLPAHEIAVLRDWILQGAIWPGGPDAHEAGSRSTHWSFQPIRDTRPAAVKARSWVRTPVDAFILARLESEGVRPAPSAGKLDLLRRVKYDLHGLPPSREETLAFLADDSPDAFERLVDRLLASPRYGEKWGRHWLDVARYAESSGLDDDIKLPHVWRYRDYVIEAFNEDLPFDRFILEQLAGDLLPGDPPGTVNRRGIVATGFLAVGPKPLVQQDKVQLRYDVVDEQIDAVSKAFLGLTIACARCHDHKFDPVSIRDYYSLASIFASIRNFEEIDVLVSKVHFEPLVPRAEYETYRENGKRVENREEWIEAAVELAVYREVVEVSGPQLAEYMLAARRVYDGGEDCGAVAAEHGLSSHMLQRWVAYLRPADVLRLYLEPWYEAPLNRAEPLAQSYQDRFLGRGRAEIAVLKSWLEEAAKAIRADDDPPERDRFSASDDRLFAEVAFREDQMGEGAADIDGPFSVAKGERESLLSEGERNSIEAMRREIEILKAKAPPEPDMAYAVKEGESVEQRVFLRGSYRSPGDPVQKGFPAILAGDSPPRITAGSGRPELARWLAQPANPLTARVAVNRLWLWHFGQGLVRTPNNFGIRGQPPTHPELLDYLARLFIESGWSVKSVHRMILASSTYRMSADPNEEALRTDPENALWSRFGRRRLTAEEMRDSMLAVDGAIDLTVGGSVSKTLDSYGSEEPFFHPDRSRRRTVYIPLYRNKLPPDLTLFDFANSTTSVGQRSQSTIAPQGLYLMNSSFVDARARALARSLLAEPVPSDHDRLADAYWAVLARPPSEEEAERLLAFLSRYPLDGSEARVTAWTGLCRVLLASNAFHYLN